MLKSNRPVSKGSHSPGVLDTTNTIITIYSFSYEAINTKSDLNQFSIYLGQQLLHDGFMLFVLAVDLLHLAVCELDSEHRRAFLLFLLGLALDPLDGDWQSWVVELQGSQVVPPEKLRTLVTVCVVRLERQLQRLDVFEKIVGVRVCSDGVQM